jgi:Lrp/AsnC family leucine-responsive transcriptional regulator
MIDSKNARILEELVRDGRKSVVEISDRLGIPRATVQERLNRMIHSGVIRKFVAIPDYSKIGKQVTAYIFVAFRSEENVSQRDLAEQISKISGVYEVSVISGQWDILLKVRAGSVEEIGSLVVEKLRTMRGIEKTETSIAFQTIKESF